MPRIRTIKPEMFESLSLKKLSRDSRYVFVGLISLADDDGRILYIPVKVRAHIYGADDDVTDSQIEAWIDELGEKRLILKYELNGVMYLAFPKWKAHQVINRKTDSKYPPFTKDGVILHGELPEDYVIPHGGLTEGSRRAPTRNREQGTGNREQGTGSVHESTRGRLTHAPTTFEVSDSMKSWAKTKLDFAPSFVESEAEKFLDWHAAKGSKFASWDRAFQNWLRKAKEFAPQAEAHVDGWRDWQIVVDTPLTADELAILQRLKEGSKHDSL